MKRILIVFFVAVSTAISSARSQTDTLVDVFPLAVGNQWIFHYDSFYLQAPIDIYENDTGSIILNVQSRIVALDSIRWQIQQYRNLLRSTGLLGGPPPTIFNIVDTTTFDVVERLGGQHHLYRNAYWFPIIRDVFPFTPLHVDTTGALRYRRVNQAGEVTILSRPQSPGLPVSLFTFRRGTGLVRYQYSGGPFTGDIYTINHQLVSSVIVGVDELNPEDRASTYVLHQNYPNPFNPSTEIRYQTSEVRHVSLKVFDLLGRVVATLVDEVKEAGAHVVTFDGSNLPSGIYFYQITAGHYTQVRKAVLIR